MKTSFPVTSLLRELPMKRLVLAALFVSSAACSSRGSSSSADASVEPAVDLAITNAAAAVRAHVVADPAFAALRRTLPLRRTDSGWETKSGSLVARLPLRADAPLHLASGTTSVDVQPEGLANAPFEAVEDTLVHRSSAFELLLAATASGVEEVRVIHEPAALSQLRWSLHASAGATVRVREGIAEVVDATGRVAIAAGRPFAVDAHGVRRALAFVLEGASLRAELDAQGLAFPITVDPLWTTAAPMLTARSSYASSTISGGRVVVLGGVATVGGATLGTAEIYTPTTNTWSSGGSCTARSGGVAVPLTAGTSAGKVFVSGGSVAASEVYDPVAKSSVGAAAPGVSITSMASAGSKVLVYNGSTAGGLAWDSATNGWSTPAGSTSTHFSNWGLASFADGRVMIYGGLGFGTSVGGVDIYRPATNDFVAGTAGLARQEFTMTVLADGTHAVAIGGNNRGTKSTSVVGTANVYDITTGTWGASATMITPRPLAASALLPNGKVVVAGGGSTGTELFNPTTSAFEIAPDAPATDVGSGLAIGTGALFVPSLYLFTPAPLGASCIVGFECMSGNCVTGACCSTATCATGAVCNTATKAGTCAKPNGTACGAASECESGLCVDGVCCNSACGGQCQACNVTGFAGTCTAVFGAPHGTRAACAGAGSADVCQQQICNGTDTTACHYAPAYTVPCGTTSCSAGKETHTSTCNGSGKCADVPKSCGVYACGATSCKSSCSADGDCIAGYYCDTSKNACVPLLGLGRKCSASSPCTAGLFCTDGVCCNVSDCGTGKTCAIPGKEGTCLAAPGTKCTLDSECGTASCVDGYCCDTACNGQCEACDVTGSEGTCTPIAGKPHGMRPTCASDATNLCASATCDGMDRGKCAAFPGSEQECRMQSCKGGTLTARALCDGSGACPAVVTTSCGGYLCDESAGACRTACSGDADCAGGFTCTDGKCAKASGFCSDDGLSVVDSTGATTSCAPYLCKDGKCQATCATSDDCVGGTICQVTASSATCVPPPSTGDTGDSGGGCAMSARGASSMAASLVALAAIAAARRRRSQRARGSESGR